MLQKWLSDSEVALEAGTISKVVGAMDLNVAQALRKIFAPHKLIGDKIVLQGEGAYVCGRTYGAA